MDKCFETFASESFRRSLNEFLQIAKSCSANLDKVPVSPCNAHAAPQHPTPTCNHCHCSPSITPKYYELPQQNLSNPSKSQLLSFRGINTPYAANHVGNENGAATPVVCHNDSYNKVSHSNFKACAATVTSSPASTNELFAWCPIEVDADGGCSIAGLYRTTAQSPRPCAFTVTGRVTSVAYNGRCVTTEDGKTHYLQGGICWPVYNAVTLDTTIDTIPAGIADAFCAGFPAENWRTWTQGLFYHITGINERKADCLIPRAAPISAHNVESKNYSLNHAHASPIQNVDIDDSILCVTDIQSDDYSDSMTESTENQPLFKVAPSGLLNEMNFEAQPRFETKHSKRRLPSPSRNKPQISTSSRSKTTPVSRWLNDIQESGRISKKKTKHRRHNMPPTLGKYPKKHTNEQNTTDSDIDEEYKLYTAAGQIIDARKLSSTRSGRLIIPTLDSRFGHKLQIARNRVVSVQHDFDETASYILRRRNE